MRAVLALGEKGLKTVRTDVRKVVIILMTRGCVERGGDFVRREE